MNFMKSLKRINIFKSTLDWHFGEFVFYSADVLFVEKIRDEELNYTLNCYSKKIWNFFVARAPSQIKTRTYNLMLFITNHAFLPKINLSKSPNFFCVLGQFLNIFK
jgi:hypothetical protein